MRYSAFTIFKLFFLGVFFISSCQKEKDNSNGINYFTRSVPIEFIIEVQNFYSWPEVNISSQVYNDGRIVKASDSKLAGDNLITSDTSDISYPSICGDTLHYSVPIGLSTVKPTDILINLSLHSQNNNFDQDIIFTYFPDSGNLTSTEFAFNENPFLPNASSSPNRNSVLDIHTSVDQNCSPGRWKIYARFQ